MPYDHELDVNHCERCYAFFLEQPLYFYPTFKTLAVDANYLVDLPSKFLFKSGIIRELGWLVKRKAIRF